MREHVFEKHDIIWFIVYGIILSSYFNPLEKDISFFMMSLLAMVTIVVLRLRLAHNHTLTKQKEKA